MNNLFGLNNINSMKMKYLFGLLVLVVCLASCRPAHKVHRENGWYHILPQPTDSLAKEPASGLCGYLVDDIVKSRFPEAPSVRSMTAKTDNPDDEMLAKLKYQKAVWRLMNKETPGLQKLIHE